MGFESHIEKIKHSSSIYLVNFDISQQPTEKDKKKRGLWLREKHI